MSVRQKAVVMRRGNNDNSTGRILLCVLSALCLALILVSFLDPSITGPVQEVTGMIITPVQKGVNQLGRWIYGITSNLSDVTSLRSENEALKERVDSLTAENSQLVLDREELARLRELLDLKEEYSDYDTVGARVIAKDSGNWFDSFTIDKGRKDGIQVDSNVLAGSGLVGIVTEVGPNWARVRSIIDDNSNVSAMISTTSDSCIIAGDLRLIDKGTLKLTNLADEDNRVHVGDKVVTSNISEKYLPGILVGYICELNNDANNLTKSGEITPVVDFKHLQEVLVIKELKVYVASPLDTLEDGNLSAIPVTVGSQTQEESESEP